MRRDRSASPLSSTASQEGMLRKRRIAGALTAAALVAAVAALAVGVTAGSAAKSGTIKAAWIYVGPHNDGGWSQAHDQGRLFVQKALGSKVQTTYKESVPEGPQVSQVIDQLIRDGNKIIFEIGRASCRERV